MANIPPIRLIDDPPWRDDGPDEALVCEKCEAEYERDELEGEYGTEQTPDKETIGYCGKHGHHNEFRWMVI